MRSTLSFAEQLRHLRRQKRRTQRAFAQELGISLSYLRKLEQGVRQPNEELIEQIVRALMLSRAQRQALLSSLPDDPEQHKNAAPHISERSAATLLGRERDLREIGNLLINQRRRLVTIAGAPGVGKTRLASAAATLLAVYYTDGTFVIELAAVQASTDVPRAIASKLALDIRNHRAALADVIAALRSRQTLLVLDNLEHLPDCNPILDALRNGCPELTLLATSRMPLQMRDETIYPLAPLPLPSVAERSDPVAITQIPATALFLLRARQASPTFVLQQTAAPVVSGICARLGGLPLAIELAAALSARISLDAIAAHLQQMPLISESARGEVEERHESLRAAIDWSYRLLSPAEQDSFARLGVYLGGVSHTSAQMLGIAGLGSLVRQSLVQQAHTASGELRYTLLETLREYARDRLMQRGLLHQCEREHAAHFAGVAEQAEAELAGSNAASRMRQIEDDLDNLRAAMSWSLAHDGGMIAARITVALHRFWLARGYLSEGRRWVEPVLAAGASHLPALLRARAYHTIGYLASQQSDVLAVGLLRRGLELFQELGDRRETARSLHALGMLARYPGNGASTHALLRAGLDMLADDEAPEIRGQLRNQLGLLELAEGNYLDAELHFRAAHAIALQAGEMLRVTRYLPDIAEALLRQGRITDAHMMFLRAQELAREQGEQEVQAEVSFGLGFVAASAGDLPRAIEHLQRALAVYQEASIGFGIARTHRHIGLLALRAADYPLAAGHLEGAIHWGLSRFIIEPVAQCLIGLALVDLHHGELELALQRYAAGSAFLRHFQMRDDPLHREDLAAVETALRSAAGDQRVERAAATALTTLASIRPQIQFPTAHEARQALRLDEALRVLISAS